MAEAEYSYWDWDRATRPKPKPQRLFWKLGPCQTYWLIAGPPVILTQILTWVFRFEILGSTALPNIIYLLFCISNAGVASLLTIKGNSNMIKYQRRPYRCDFSQFSYFYQRRKGMLEAVAVLTEIEHPTHS